MFNLYKPPIIHFKEHYWIYGPENHIDSYLKYILETNNDIYYIVDYDFKDY